MASPWDDLVDENTVIRAECPSCEWRASGTGEDQVREVFAEADKHSDLHPGVSIELDYAEAPEVPDAH